ncbi:Jerky -like [Araneus ventricosus]|uniref:Jerky-like n=1 Tax=Araneus ventricosus TaxID=182803 RepID=A0A4Y2DXV5_ARAVE|nr:Jerky -like [Araneus ventricosus]
MCKVNLTIITRLFKNPPLNETTSKLPRARAIPLVIAPAYLTVGSCGGASERFPIVCSIILPFWREKNVPFKSRREELCTDDGEISAMFLPPNTTALIQIMDENVIQNTKLGYRKLLLTNNLNDPVHNENSEKTLKNVNLKDVVFRLANCWTFVSTLLINKSWKNLLPNFIDSEVEEIQLASLINLLQNTNPMSNTEALQWTDEADDSLARNKILTDDEIYQDGRNRR